MAQIEKAVFDAGPLLHLEEISQSKILQLFTMILTTAEIVAECRRIEKKLLSMKNIVVKELRPESKDFAKYLIGRYDIDLGEATALALCRQEKIHFLFTDDLDARDTAHALGFEPHGTLAVLVRAYQEKLLSKKEVQQAVDDLYVHSTLFFTRDLRDWTLKEIEKG